MPVLCGLANLLPRICRTGDLLPQPGWLPPGFFSLWIIATGVHLYCLGYVYDFDLHHELLAPVIWVLLWTACHRATDFEISRGWQRALLVPPLLITFLAPAQNGNKVFLLLTILNVAIYGGICFRHRKDRLALHLLLVLLVALIAGLPEDWGRAIVPEFSRAKWIGAGVVGLSSTLGGAFPESQAGHLRRPVFGHRGHRGGRRSLGHAALGVPDRPRVSAPAQPALGGCRA